MNLVFIITDYGSFNNFLGELSVHLVREGVQVHVICSSSKVIDVDDKFDYIEEGVRFDFIEFPRGFNVVKHFLTSRKVKTKLAKINPSFVFIHFTTGIFTSTFSGKLGYKTAGMFHGLGYPVVEGALKKIVYKSIESRCISRVDDVWVLNSFDKCILENDFPERKVNLLPTKGLGCDLKKFNPNNFSSELRRSIREEWEIADDDFVIAFTGRFVFFKGFDKVVKAALELIYLRNRTNVKLLLIGASDSVHPTGLTEEEQRKMNNCKSIIELGFRSDVEKFLSITDLFVFPSEKEGMPVCIIEALAMGVPVITANSRGCNDLIQHGHNGVILEENTVHIICNMIEKFIEKREFYNMIRENVLIERELLDRNNFVAHQAAYILNR